MCDELVQGIQEVLAVYGSTCSTFTAMLGTSFFPLVVGCQLSDDDGRHHQPADDVAVVIVVVDLRY